MTSDDLVYMLFEQKPHHHSLPLHKVQTLLPPVNYVTLYKYTIYCIFKNTTKNKTNGYVKSRFVAFSYKCLQKKIENILYSNTCTCSITGKFSSVDYKIPISVIINKMHCRAFYKPVQRH